MQVALAGAGELPYLLSSYAARYARVGAANSVPPGAIVGTHDARIFAVSPAIPLSRVTITISSEIYVSFVPPLGPRDPSLLPVEQLHVGFERCHGA